MAESDLMRIQNLSSRIGSLCFFCICKAGAMYFRETDYDDKISPDYRKKSAVLTALENLIQEKSYTGGKDKHFATLVTLESSCDLSESSWYPT